MRGCAKKLVCRVDYFMVLRYYFKTKASNIGYPYTKVFAVVNITMIVWISAASGCSNSLLMTIYYDTANAECAILML